MSSPESDDHDFQCVNEMNLRPSEGDSSQNSVSQYFRSGSSGTQNVLLRTQSASGVIPHKRSQYNIANETSSSQSFKQHLKKLHLAVNKILESDRLTKHRSPSKKNLKSNQEAYDEMLDAIRELGPFVVQRQKAPASCGNHSKNLDHTRFRCGRRVRSKSTTFDDSVSVETNSPNKLKHLQKSTKRTTSLTKRSKSLISHPATIHQASDVKVCYSSKHTDNIEGVDVFCRGKATFRFPVKKNIAITSDSSAGNAESSQHQPDPEITCLEAELSHRDTLIKYLSEQLSKLYQDNDRIFAEYEQQEANLTNHLRLLRSRLAETSENLRRPDTTSDTTDVYLNSDYTTHVTQSISHHINFNVTDSIVHQFATEINYKLLHTDYMNETNIEIDHQERSRKLQLEDEKQKSQLVELQELDLAVQNLLTYWEVKSKETNYPLICQQFFKALLDFSIFH
ncbi:unnamed protein product [Heterobilharzia americana]|nr:unnamed protein product [Heterobilharzia americana]